MTTTRDNSIRAERLERGWPALRIGLAAQWAVPAILLLTSSAALILRLAEPDLMEFRLDSAYWSLEGLKIIRGVSLPLVGQQVGSVTVPLYNGPIFSYFVALVFRIIGTSPVYPTLIIGALGAMTAPLSFVLGKRLYGVRVGLVASLFFAFSPWLVLYNRMLWPQSLVPLLVLLSIAALYGAVVGSHRWLLLLWGILVGVSTQLHLSALSLVPAGFIFLFVFWRRRASFLLPIVGLIVGYSPILIYDLANNWVNLRGFLVLTNARIALDQAGLLRDLKFAWDLENMLSGQGLWASKLSSGTNYLPIWAEWGQGLLTTLVALVAGFFLVREWVMRGARTVLDRAFAGAQADVLLMLYLAFPLGALLFSGGPILRHYYLVALPSAFLLLARGCLLIPARLQPWLRIGIALIIALNLTTNLSMLEYLSKFRGGGDFGTVLADKVEVAVWIEQHAKGHFVLDASRTREALSYDFLLVDRMPVQFDESRGTISTEPNSSVPSCLVFEPEYSTMPIEAAGKPQSQIGGIRIVELKPECASTR